MEVLSPQFEQIASDLLGAEGPVFSKDGRLFMVAPEIMKDGDFAGELLEIVIAEKKAKLVSGIFIGGHGGIPAGMQCDKENFLWVADMRHGLLKVDLSMNGDHEQISKVDGTGRAMQGCNDCIFDYDGTLWITAPAGPIAPAPYTRSKEESFGTFYSLTRESRESKTFTMSRQDRCFQFSNGIAVQHDSSGRPRKLIVAETFPKCLWEYDITGLGTVGAEKKLWAKVPGDHKGGPDGMDFDEAGNLLVANWGSGHIEVYSPEGTLTHRIKCPFDRPSNLHFRADSTEVYVTEHSTHGIWRFNWQHKGAKQYCDL